MCVILYTY